MTPKEAKEFLREFLGDKPNFREERPGQDEEVYRQMDMLAEAIDLAISALEKHEKSEEITSPLLKKWRSKHGRIEP